jgi:prepilin-type processing-associated H-X9-DG protein
MHTVDYNDYFPTRGVPGDIYDRTLPVVFGGGVGGDACASSAEVRLLFPYISNVNRTVKMMYDCAFWCPEDQPGSLNISWPKQTYYYWYGNSYSYNNAGGFGNYRNRTNCGDVGLGGRRILNVTTPSKKGVSYDTGINARQIYNWPHGTYKTNMVFVDGHVNLMYTVYPPSGINWNSNTPDIAF